MAAEPVSSRQIGLEAGEWEGEYIDVRGYRGAFQLSLETKADTIGGKYRLTVRTEDKPQIVSGEVQGRIEGENVRLTLQLGPKGERAEYEARLRPAGSFAKQALFGVVNVTPQSNFGGGVWIAWRFGRSVKEGR